MVTQQRPAGTPPISNADLARHTATLAGGVLAVHLYIVFGADQKVDTTSTVLLGLVALYYWWFHWRRTPAMRQRAYARYLAHVSAFLVVCGSYWIHAAALTVTGDSLDHSWWGPLFGMSIVWGCGLLLHTFGAAASAGYDDVRL